MRDMRAIGDDGVVSAPGASQRQRLGRAINDDDLCGRQRLEALNADVTQPPAPITTTFVPG